MAESYSVLASRLLQQGEPTKAIEVCKRLVQLLPESQGAWDRLGWAQTDAGDYAAALESFLHFDKSGIREGKSLVPYLLAKAYLGADQPEKAADVLRHIMPEAEVEATIAKYSASLKATRDAKGKDLASAGG